MSGTKKFVDLSTPVLVAALLLGVNFTSSAFAQEFENDSPFSSTVFSKLIADLDQIKETAFTQPFSIDAEKNSSSSASETCQCEHCGPTAKVCAHLAHPKAAIGTFAELATAELATAELWDDGDLGAPLACSHEVRCTDVIPPVPDIEDYATPDRFVDEDMINKLQSDKFTMNQGIGNYCEQMAKLLSDTLSSENLSDTQKTAAINSAMKLAVLNAQIAAEAKIAQIKASHDSELAIMRGRLLQYSYIESNQQRLFQWLSPIYNNVNRNFQEIEKMSDSSAQLKRCLNIIQTQFQEGQTANGKNQLIVTKPEQLANRPLITKPAVQRVSNQFVQQESDGQITPVDLQILELRLKKAEGLINVLTSYAADSASRQQEYTNGQNPSPTHQRVSYDRLTPITPLQPRR